jgi:hypothetical protein
MYEHNRGGKNLMLEDQCVIVDLCRNPLLISAFRSVAAPGIFFDTPVVRVS